MCLSHIQGPRAFPYRALNTLSVFKREAKKQICCFSFIPRGSAARLSFPFDHAQWSGRPGNCGEGLGLFRKPSSGGPTQLHTMKIKLSNLWGGCKDLFFLSKLVRHLYFLKNALMNLIRKLWFECGKDSGVFSIAQLGSWHLLQSLTCGNELALHTDDKTIRGWFGDYRTQAYTS